MRIDHATLVRIDAASVTVRAVFRVGPDPLLLATASDHVWTLNLGDGTLTQLDPASGDVNTVRFGEAVGAASDGRDLWITHDRNLLSRIDGVTGAEEDSLVLARRPLFALRDAGFVGIGYPYVWLTVPDLERPEGDQMLWRIDATTGRVTGRVRVGPDPLPPLLIVGRHMWLMTLDGLTRIDLASLHPSPVGVDPQGGGLASGAGSVWVGRELSGEVLRLDPRTMRPLATTSIDDAVRGIAYGGGRVWVTTHSGLTVIDPASDEVMKTLRLGTFEAGTGPIGVAYLNGSVWVSVE
jgi:streptogramin lyase